MMLPSVLTVELTYRCNHKCLFCYCPWENEPSMKEAELSTDEWKKIFDKVKKYGVKQITFSGGEAILRDDLIDLISYAHNAGFSVGLISNGKNLNREFLSKLRPYNVLLSISVPGIESFHKTTGVDNVENVLALFALCKELGIKTVANIAVTKNNIKELFENIALPLVSGATYILLNRFLPGGRGLENKQYLLSIDEINEMFDVAEEVLSRAGLYGHVGTELPYCIIKNPDKYKYLQISSFCSAAKEFFVIDPSGYVKVCNHSPTRVCFWTEIDGLGQNEYWNRFVTKDYIPLMCKNCEYLGVKCDGGCREAAHVYFGDIADADPCFDNIIKEK